jgi:tRNA pseudouridine13 synthase
MTLAATDLPLITTDLPGLGGTIKAQPEDFQVEEIPAYEPSGQGEHLYLWVQKRGIGADYFLRQIARRLGVPSEEIGTAGLKDRHAITRQWVSVPASAEPRLPELDGDGITLLSHTRHGNKLKPGHLRGNRFTIRIRQVQNVDALPWLLNRLQKSGMPNFYGSQRFGNDGETLQLGMQLLLGRSTGKVSGFMRRLGLSAVQSALFNTHVATRMRDGLLRTVLEGDAMKKWPHGGIFTAQDVATEQTRLETQEIIPAGPIFGKKMFPTTGLAEERELATLHEAGLTRGHFADQGKLMAGTRRYMFIYPEDIQSEVLPEGVQLRFTLPAGSYATVLLHELTHSTQLEAEDADE